MKQILHLLDERNISFLEQFTISLPNVLQYFLLLKVKILTASFILCLLSSVLALGLTEVNERIYDRLSPRFVRKPILLVKLYKVHLKIRQFSYYLSRCAFRFTIGPINWLDVAYNDLLMVRIWRGLLGFFDPRKISTQLALLLTTYRYREKISSWVSINSVMITKENIEFLLAVLPLLAIFAGLIYMIRFVSLKGRLERGADKLNQQLIIETLDIHRRLIQLLSTIIFEGSENINYIIHHRALLTKKKLQEISPMIKGVEEGEVIWQEALNYQYFHSREYYMVKNIKEINQLVKIITEAKENHLFKEMLWLQHYHHEMFGLRFLDREPEALKNVFERQLFTHDAVQKMIENKSNRIHDINHQEKEEKYNEYILDDIVSFEKNIDDQIIDSIEFIVELSLYHQATHKLLHFNSNKIERTLDSWITKE